MTKVTSVGGFKRRAGMMLLFAAALLVWHATGMIAPPAAKADPVSTADQNTWTTDGYVNVIACRGDITYVGGSFSGIGPVTQGGASVDAVTGDLDCIPDFDGNVDSAVSDSSGGWYIGGDFTRVLGVPRSKLAHILGDGSLDPDWNPGANGTVKALHLSADGKSLFVGGAFTGIGGQGRNNIAKLAAHGAGAGDPVWNPNASGQVNTLELSADGNSLFIGGMFGRIGSPGPVRHYIAKLDANNAGAADGTWNPNANHWVNSLVLSADGNSLFVGGIFSTASGSPTIGGQDRNYIAKLDANNAGAADAAWNPVSQPVGMAYIYSLQLSADGNSLFAGGQFNNIGGQPRSYIAKIETADTGRADATWNPGCVGIPYALAVSTDGSSLFMGGSFNQVGGLDRKGCAKLSTSGAGTVDATWHPSVDGEVDVVSSNSDGSSVFIGGSLTALRNGRNNLAAINNLTGEATGWNPGTNGTVWALAFSADGSSLFVGGDFNGTASIGGLDRNRLAKVSTSGAGSVDPDWNPDANATVRALALSGDGNSVYAGGDFTGTIGGQNRNYIAKLDAGGTGAADPSWNPNANSSIYSLLLSPDGNSLFVGGVFETIYSPSPSIGGRDRNYIAKLDSGNTGAADASWDPNPNGTILCMASSVDGSSLYVGGSFATWYGSPSIGGRDRNYIAKLDSGNTGAADANWDLNANMDVYSLAVTPDGNSVIAGGGFSTDNGSPTIGGQDRNRVAQLDADGAGLAMAWNPNAYDNYANAVAVTPDGNSVFVGGNFTAIGGLNTSFARFRAAEPPTVTTTAISNIPSTTADSGGNVTDDGGAAVTHKGVCWSTSPNPTITDPKTDDGTGTGTYTSHITGLTQGTPYHVRAYATNSVGTSYGSQVDFTTLTTPTVTTTAITNIGTTTADSGGNVTSDGGDTVTARGVCWSTSPSPTISDPKTDDGTGTGTFTSSITSLAPSTPYHVRAYATNSVGTSYGGDVQFTTNIYGVSVTPATDGKSGDPSTTVTYNLTVENTGNVTDSFNPTVTGNTWPTPVPSAVGPLAPGDSQVVHVNVSIPAATAAGATDTANVTYTSAGDASKSAASALTTTANATAPTITGVNPPAGPPGIQVTITGTNFGATQGGSTVTIGGVEAIVVSWSDTKIVVIIPPGATSGAVVVTTAQGGSNENKKFTVVTSTWYLAEGTNAWGFSTYITIQNPNTDAVTAKITYMDPNAPASGKGIAATRTITLPAQSQTSVSSAPDIGNTDFSTRVECLQGKNIAVDRTMFWTGEGASSPEGHSSIGTTSPSTTWYLPEGSSAWGFETWTLVQNPNPAAESVTLTYMIEGQPSKAFSKTVPAYSRATYSMASDIGPADASVKVTSDQPVIAEESMYRNNRREGSCSIGATAPAKDYFLSEGTTAWGFTTYVLVQNPNDKATDVTLTYMTPSGPATQPAFTMPANSRKTVRVNDIKPSNGYPIDVSNTDLSIQVTGTKPIIAERSMYWGGSTPLGEACHASIGLDFPHMTFYLPDGQTSNGYQTWTLIQNPNPTAVTVRITYMTPSGKDDVTFTDEIAPGSRKTYNMADKIPSGRASIMVQSLDGARPVMVERSMYWNSRGAGTNTIGGFSD